mgnify:CR=1 FL=1
MANEFDIDAVAALARLALTDDERRRFRAQLADVLAYVDVLAGAPVDDLRRAGADDAPAVRWRDDVAAASLSRDAALANAADTRAGFFRIPPLRD